VLVVLLVATGLAVPVESAIASPNAHQGRACGTLAFTPRTEDGAFELTARGVSCEIAREVALAIDAGETRPLSFRCRGRWESGPGLPHSHWFCVRGGQEVSWVGSPKPRPSQTSETERVCGPLLPGSGGAVSYIRTWNVSCRQGWKISHRAVRRFCARRGHCKPLAIGIDRGRVRVRGWRCEVRKGYEYTWVRCLEGRRRLVSETAS
jgi:hypothetical protein